MKPERWTEIKKLLHQALELPPDEIEGFLDRSCGDSKLRLEVEALIQADGHAGQFLDRPILGERAAAAAPTPGSATGESSGESRFTPGTVLDGRYRIVHLLGRGGMGEVYRADDLRLEQPVALKFLPELAEGDEKKRTRLVEEVKIARQVTHPNVCRVYDVGEIDSLLFLSMELIEGEDLASLLRRIGRPTPEKALELSRQLAEGLAAAHDRGVLHCDLKPANLMIDGEGRPRITDFGIARAAGSPSDKGGHGTPAYMAPEQLTSREASPETDVYALGLVMYELFTGRRAFETESAAELMRLHREEPPPPPCRWVKNIDPAVEKLIQCCLEKDPHDRLSSASEVIAALSVSDDASRETTSGWRPAPGQDLPRRPNWALERRLSEGGFGDVWLAANRKTRERRVFKFCYDPVRLRSLQREITLFRLLKETLGDRDDITRVLDWNFDEAPYFIESEYTAGGSLVEWAESQGGLERIALPTRLDIVAQVATALAAAHSVGVLHKDVKPRNILMAMDSKGRLQARLSDFGVGFVTEKQRLVDAGITALGMTDPQTQTDSASSHDGTRLYMAPELLEGKPVTVQADIYALGVTLYQMVVGDFSRVLAPGWDRHVADALLREDIAAAIDGSPEQRLNSASHLATRLRTLEIRREEQAEQQREESRAQQLEISLASARRRRRSMALAIAVLALFSTVVTILLFDVRQQAHRANREARTASRMTTLLIDLFESENPYLHPGQASKTSARKILDRGAERIERELSAEPLVQARMMQAMGMVYYELGAYDEARRLLEKALEIRQQTHGVNNIEVAESMTALAEVLRVQAHFERAEELAREALALYENSDADGKLQTSDSLDLLARILYDQGALDESEENYREALSLRRQRLGGERSDDAKSLHGLAIVLMGKGESSQSEDVYRQLLDLQIEILGPDHPDVAYTMNSLALLIKEDHERLGEARDLYRGAVAIRKKTLGSEHPDTALTINNLAESYLQAGDYDEAEVLLWESLAAFQASLGSHHPYVAYVEYGLARLFNKTGQPQKAKAHLERSLAIYLEVFGEDHPYSKAIRNDLKELLD